MRLHGVPGVARALEGRHACHGSKDVVLVIVAQALEHLNVLALAARLFENGTKVVDDDGVGGNDEGRLALFLVVNFRLVHVHGLLRRRLEHVFERRHGLGQVFGKRRRYYLDIVQANLDVDAPR